MQPLITVVQGWRTSLRRIQVPELILLPVVAGTLTGVGTMAFVELINLVQRLAIGSADWPLRVLPHVP